MADSLVPLAIHLFQEDEENSLADLLIVEDEL